MRVQPRRTARCADARARRRDVAPGPARRRGGPAQPITPAPWHLTATLDVAQARPGGTYVVRGTSDCDALTVGIEGAEPPREESVGATFTLRERVPATIAPDEWQVSVGTSCGPAEADEVVVLPLRVTRG